MNQQYASEHELPAALPQIILSSVIRNQSVESQSLYRTLIVLIPSPQLMRLRVEQAIKLQPH
jgi:hypothetical protein